MVHDRCVPPLAVPEWPVTITRVRTQAVSCSTEFAMLAASMRLRYALHYRKLEIVNFSSSVPNGYVLGPIAWDCDNALQARFFFQQLISGVSYCHSREICHRDLKV